MTTTNPPVESTLNRRQLLRACAPLTAVAAAAGLLSPATVLGAWSPRLFTERSAQSGIDALLGGDRAQPHPDFVLKAEDKAENGGHVRIEIICPLPGVESVSLLLGKIPMPIAAVYRIGPRWAGRVMTSVKLAGSGRVTAIAHAGDRAWRADKDIQVVAGGCA